MQRRALLMVVLIALAAILAACGPRIESIGELRRILVYPASSLEQIKLPSQVTVTFGDGSSELVDVKWDTASLPERLVASVELTGKVKGTNLSARQQLEVRKPTVEDEEFWLDPPIPTLTAEELQRPDLSGIMEERALTMNWTVEMAEAWSPDRQALAYVTSQSFWVWPLGAVQPTRVEAVGDVGYGGLGQPAWSCDGNWLSVQLGFSSERQFLVFNPSDLKLVQRLSMYGCGFWSPDSNSILYASDSGIQQTTVFTIGYTTDLALFSMDTGEKRVLLRADDKTLHSAEGWAGPGRALYSRNLAGKYEENLLLIIAP